MSKGSPIVRVRFPRDLLAMVQIAIAQRNEFTRDEPWVMTDFVIAAVEEKLSKMERSRRGKGVNRRRIKPE